MAKKKGETPDQKQLREERERRHQAQGMLVGMWAGRGLPLLELGITFDPPMSEAEIATTYAKEIELGVAEQNQKLIGWLWDSAEGGNASVQMYLANHRLGWKGVPKLKAPSQKTAPPAPEAGQTIETPATPPANSGLTAAGLGKIYKFPPKS